MKRCIYSYIEKYPILFKNDFEIFKISFDLYYTHYILCIMQIDPIFDFAP